VTRRKLFRAFVGSLALIAVVFLIVWLYTLSGGGARTRLMTLMLINLIGVLGFQVFIGNTGIMSFGQVSFAAIGAYLTAILTTPVMVKSFRIANAPFDLDQRHFSAGVSLLVSFAIVFILAALIGSVIVRLPPLSATIVTLSWMIVIHAVIINWKSLTAGAEGFYGVPPLFSNSLFTPPDPAKGLAATTLTWVLVGSALAIFSARLLRASPLGLRMQASREDSLASSALGMNVNFVRWLAFMISALFLALSGVLRSHFLGSMSPSELYLDLTFVYLAMLLLGGVKSVTGAVLGTLIVTFGQDLMRTLGDGPMIAGLQLPQFFGLPLLFLGAVIMGIMFYRPDGLLKGLELDDVFARWLPPAKNIAVKKGALNSALPAQTTNTLATKKLGKTFGRIQAVKDASLEVKTGQIIGLIGPNGAGKTTMMNLISGVLDSSQGAIMLDSKDVTRAGSMGMARSGVARSFQNLRLFKDLTVRENVEVAASVAKHRSSYQVSVDEALARFDLLEVATRKAGTLAYGFQRRVEFARALALQPHFLLLDEPAAGMTETETHWLMQTIQGIRNDYGCGILVVEHDLPFIMNACEKIFVMNWGNVIASGTPEEIQKNPEVIEAYIGAKH
jgi:branched-chain amino acid transport system permease protein